MPRAMTAGMSFRVDLPLEHAAFWSLAAADGQMGCIMKLYRDLAAFRR